MLVKFTSKAAASVSMFEKDAVSLIKMLGYTGAIPSAIRGEDVAARLELFESALKVAAEAEMPLKYEDDGEPPPIPLNRRAYPLLELLRTASTGDQDVMWDYEYGIV